MKLSVSSIGITLSVSQEKEEHPPSIPPPPPPPSSAPPTTAASIQIRRDYNPKVPQVPPPSQQTAPSQYLISPITGEKIPVDKIHEHMRYGAYTLLFSS